ncbi:hypothetical protein EW146_g1320 [Bondarzewia mesenterica]|uniref:peptidylprolyl isomerase n=1 Tax=Bondarzewia mesenterica TaxID=1095465 RepID=A0A4S4MAG9_9AGAM|nr:hypothetical protein EW146_g1320 [Bondarzewia mesenterica]
MPVAVAVWSIAIKPGERESIIPQGDLRITNVALGDELQDDSGRTSVKLTYLRPVNVEDSDSDSEEAEIEGTEATTIEQATVDVTLEADEEFLFELAGKNTIYLTGNYIDQSPDNVPYNDDSEPEEEDEFDLHELGSDVEVDELEINGTKSVPLHTSLILPTQGLTTLGSSRFEEIHDVEEAPKSLKRPRGSDALETDGSTEQKSSKSQQKKANKKLKAESGAAILSGSDAKTEKANEEAKKDKKEKKHKKEKKMADGKEGGEGGGEKSTDVTKELAGGLKVKDVKLGTGPQAKRGQTVHMRYIGKLQNGKVFDSNTKGKPVSLLVDLFLRTCSWAIDSFPSNWAKARSSKACWDIGIQGMQAGGERLLTIPPNLGYGNKKSGPIPPNSTLTFECKLVDLK